MITELTVSNLKSLSMLLETSALYFPSLSPFGVHYIAQLQTVAHLLSGTTFQAAMYLIHRKTQECCLVFNTLQYH